MDFHRFDADLKKILATPLEHIDLSVRAANVLRVHGFKYLGDLVPLTDIQYLRMPNFGQRSLTEIKALLSNNGLKNGIHLNGWNRQVAERIREEIKAQERRSRTIASSGGVEDNLIQLSKASHQLRVSLVRRITELGLSSRLTNRLIEKNCVYVGDVITFTDAELLRTWNFGRKSLRELHKILKVFGLKTGYTLKGWNRRTADALRTELESEVRETWAAGTKYQTNLEIKTLEQELEAVLKLVVSGRNVDLVSKLWGWSGHGQRTLESVGEEYGLTRERVRQIAAKAEKHIRNLPVVASHLQAAVQYINEQSPVLAIDVEEGLRSSGLISSPFEISGLLNAAEKLLTGSKFFVTEIDDFKFIVPKGSRFYSKVTNFFRLIRRKTRPDGCVNFEGVLDELEVDDENEIRALKRFVDSHLDLRWLDEEKNWLWDPASGYAGYNRVVNVIHKVFSITSALHVSELRQALNRYHRISHAPPARILLALCRQLHFLIVTNSEVSTKSGALLPSSLTPLEGKLIKAFDGESVLDRARLERNALRLGMNRSSFYVMIGYSPLVVRLSRGVYAPIGADVPPGSVEAHQPTFNPGKRVLDFGWRDGRYIWILYNLTEALARDGLANVPASMKEFLQGEWPAQPGNAGRAERISISDNRIYGFLRLIERRGAEAGDKVVLVFDMRERLLRIDLGGDDLLDRYQDNDFDLADKYLSQVDLDGKD